MTKYELIATAGLFKGQVFPIIEFPVTIGRSLDCNIIIPENDDMVSRFHCVLDLKNDQLVVQDTGSSNGTFVNGCEISEKTISPLLPIFERNKSGVCHWIALNKNDEVSIGKSTFSINVITTLTKVEQEEIKEDADTKVLDAMYNPERLRKIEHYRIIKKIGSGGAGDVFQVEDTRSGDIIALKMLKYRVQRKEDELKRFLREIDNLKKLQHPNIISFLNTGKKSGIYYFTTEYCNGGSLIDWLSERDTLVSLDEALPIILQVLDALEYAHSFNIDKEFSDDIDLLFSGLVHRDIKPGNILLNNDKNGLTVKIADFGLSKIRSGGATIGMLTQTGTVGGTVEFLCRQQMIDYKHVRGGADLWSTMAVLYYMLTSEPPREFDKKVPPYKTILTTLPIPIRERLPDFPEAFARIIDRALDDSVVLPYRTAGDLKKDLQRILTISQAIE